MPPIAAPNAWRENLIAQMRSWIDQYQTWPSPIDQAQLDQKSWIEREAAYALGVMAMRPEAEERVLMRAHDHLMMAFFNIQVSSLERG